MKDLDLDRFAARSNQVKPATIRLRYAAISSFYGFAVRQGYVPFNPIDRIKRPKGQRKQGARPLDGELVAARIATIEECNQDNRHVRLFSTAKK